MFQTSRWTWAHFAQTWLLGVLSCPPPSSIHPSILDPPLNGICTLIAVRNSSCGKVLFSQACVKNSVHRGGRCMPHCMLGYTPTPDDRCSGRYASYWNAFLFHNVNDSLKLYAPEIGELALEFNFRFESQ